MGILAEEDIQGIVTSIPVSRHVVTEKTLLFEPSEKDIVSFKNPKTRTGRLRKVFLNTPLEEEEQKWLADLHTHIKKEELQFPPSLQKEYLRYLQHARGSVSATVNLLQANETFRKEFLCSLKDVDIMEHLQSGFMYWHGRDLNQRPVLVVRTAKLCQKTKAGDIVRLVGFILEWMVKHGLVPGRVENWTVLVDLKDTGLTSISMETVRSLVTTLHMNYRFRNTKVVIMKCPWIGTAVYKMISPLLPADTKDKVTFCSSVKDAQKLLANLIDPRQLEEQFGGNAPNCEKPEDFYPYKFFPDIDNSASVHESVPASYLTSGKLWEDHDQATQISTKWLKRCAVSDFATPSSCSYLNAKFGRSIQPATNIVAHIKALKSLFQTTIEGEPHSADQICAEQNCIRPNCLSRNTSLADVVIAKNGGSTQMPEELDKIQSEADKRTEMESEAELEHLCLRIASMVNNGRIKDAIALIKDRESHTKKSVQDTIMLNSMTDAYHMVELEHVSGRPSKLGLVNETVSNGHPEESTSCEGKDVDSPMVSSTRHETNTRTNSSMDPIPRTSEVGSKLRDDDDNSVVDVVCCMRRRIKKRPRLESSRATAI